MVNYFIYAKDYSGSTRDVKYYHNNGLKTFEEFKCDVENIKEKLLIPGEPPTESKVVYLHWNDKCVEVNEDETRTAYENLYSDWAGTYPNTIIQYLKENYIHNENDRIKLLYIITDGMISEGGVTECFKSNENMNYETVVFHAFNRKLNEIDFSVAASFFKSICIVYRNYELYDRTDISQEFAYDQINVDNFEAKKDEMKSYIRLKFMRNYKEDARALKEINKLKKLRGRLFYEMSLKTASSEKKYVNLESKDRSVFLSAFVNTDWYMNLHEIVYTEKVDIEKSISTFINFIISDAKSYSFDALKFDTEFDTSVQEQQITSDDFPAEEEIEFPDIILTDDKGIPVVILTEFNLINKLIFHRTTEFTEEVTPASFNKFKSTMECPLFLMNDQDISESIGYFYTLKVYKLLIENNRKTEPRTRKPFHGGLVLTSTNQFDKYNDYILSATYFNGKKVYYNVGLFYYILWKNCENKVWMDRNVVEQFKKYAMRRISETICKIGLSSLPLDPQINVPLLTALWYCVELSSWIFKNDPENFKQERLRLYHGIAGYMIEILKYFEYDLDLESIRKRIEILGLITVLKKIQKRKDKIYYLLETIFKTVDGFLVSEIEKPFNLYKLNYLKFNHKEILLDEVLEEQVHLNDYVHLMHSVSYKPGKSKFKICKKTFRPFFVIDRNKSFYTELLQNTKKVVINNDNDKDKIKVVFEETNTLQFDRFLSLYKLFIDCVKDTQKYPTLPEYVEYICKKKKFNEEAVTIFPSDVYLKIKDVYKRYQRIVKKTSVTQFIKKCETYVTRPERIKAEKRTMFSDVKEINEFISSEELKVHLRKKT